MPENAENAPDRAGSEAEGKKAVIHGLELGDYDPKKGFPKGRIVQHADGKWYVEPAS